MESASLTRFTFRNITKTHFKKRKMCGLPRLQRETLLRALEMCIRKVAHYVFPNDAKGLYDEYVMKKALETEIFSGITKKMMNCKRGSVEKRVLRA